MTEPTSRPTPSEPTEPETLNPELKQNHDSAYAEAQNGSTPLDTISVNKTGGTAVWPAIWAVATLVLVLITLFLIFG